MIPGIFPENIHACGCEMEQTIPETGFEAGIIAGGK